MDARPAWGRATVTAGLIFVTAATPVTACGDGQKIEQVTTITVHDHTETTTLQTTTLQTTTTPPTNGVGHTTEVPTYTTPPTTSGPTPTTTTFVNTPTTTPTIAPPTTATTTVETPAG